MTPGSELTLEPFRWDQRLFTFLLQIGKARTPELQGSTTSHSESHKGPAVSTLKMSEVTGGTSYSNENIRSVSNCHFDETVIRSSRKPRFQIISRWFFFQMKKRGSSQFRSSFSTHKQRDTDCMSSQDVIRQVKDRDLIKRPGFGGFWPIPEAFWPESNMNSLVISLEWFSASSHCSTYHPIRSCRLRPLFDR